MCTSQGFREIIKRDGVELGWAEVKIEDVKADKKYALAMGPFGSNIKAENFVTEGVPVIKGGNLNGSFILEDKFDYLTEEKADELISSNAYRGDIVITHRGTIGQVGLIPENSKYKRYVVSQSQLKLSLNDEIINPYFVYYFLRSHQGQHALLLNASQVGVPAIAQALTSLKNLKIPYPAKRAQDEIVEIILDIDQKIELNQRMNETLEGMARAIFKSWFVDFDPVHAKAKGREPEGMDARTAALFPSTFTPDGLPEGWTQESVISSAEYINGAAYKDMHFSKEPDAWPVVKIAELKNGISPQTKFTNTDLGDKFKLDTGDILFSWSGSPDTSIDTFIWTGGKGWLNQHIFKVVNKTRAERCFTYWLLKYLKPEFIEVARNKQTTGLGHVTRKDMEWMQYCKPNQPVLDLFYETVGLLLDQIENNLIQNQTLAALRDTLLPKLISGELRIDTTQTDLKEAV